MFVLKVEETGNEIHCWGKTRSVWDVDRQLSESCWLFYGKPCSQTGSLRFPPPCSCSAGYRSHLTSHASATAPIHRLLLIADSYFHLNADGPEDQCKLETQTYSASFLSFFFFYLLFPCVFVEECNCRRRCLLWESLFAPTDCHEFKEGLKLHWPALKSTVLILMSNWNTALADTGAIHHGDTVS